MAQKPAVAPTALINEPALPRRPLRGRVLLGAPAARGRLDPTGRYRLAATLAGSTYFMMPPGSSPIAMNTRQLPRRRRARRPRGLPHGDATPSAPSRCFNAHSLGLQKPLLRRLPAHRRRARFFFLPGPSASPTKLQWHTMTRLAVAAVAAATPGR
jgi:hypothetical protein